MLTLLYAFFKGLIFGATMTAIPGPIFFLIMQRTLSAGALAGLVCGFGSVAADAVFAIVALIGLSFVTNLLIAYQGWFSLIGGLFLLYLGVKTFYSAIAIKPIGIHDKRLISSALSAFVLTIANPITIITFSIIFAGLGSGDSVTFQSTALAMVSGVIFGAAGTVILLTLFFSFFRDKLSMVTLRRINKIGGVILFGFGIATIVRSIHYFIS